ncbi:MULTISPECIES: YjcZ family sporulation protein [Sutcliffiella]|uniref:Sporulation protein YjcZ n=1 Tax=Sutcliffiella cohnii TaxID=33932 RepID=A0A223KMP8_9BACI|nr:MULTISPECIES: YjcZ family sporulation protein [Sutcliffiella]AST90667.1 sporulation protein YjcZ [Sutcliffiella cohnii]WBL16320.1 YjcZ family sporulation protein [Sutcliffiella sp. NC1]
MPGFQNSYGGGYTLIVVLFILLVIIGAVWYGGPR